MSLLNSLLEAIGRLFGRAPPASAPLVAPRSAPPTATPSAAPSAAPAAAPTAATRKRVVTLTPVAASHIAEIMRGQPHRYLRISGDPASGAFGYKMNFVDDLNPASDFLYESDGVTVIVDRKQAKFLQGTTLDYKTTPSGANGLHFDNPNERND